MAYNESGGARILLCLGLLLVSSSSFCSCRALTGLEELRKLKENSTHSQGPVIESGLHHGKLLIGPNPQQSTQWRGIRTRRKQVNVDMDYQDDMGWAESWQSKGRTEEPLALKQDGSAVERLLQLEPRVECAGNFMKLQINDGAPSSGSLFFVDRGNLLSPLPLSKLPPSCGYTVTSSRRDFVLVAPYDGCFVSVQEDCYVLPLHWCGLPVKMSCPIMKPSSSTPPMVSCHSEGMVVKTEWMVPIAKIQVKVNGLWEPLMKASAKCRFSVVVHPEGVVVSAHFLPCLEKKDDMYILELSGEGEIRISCPAVSATQPTKGPSKVPERQPEMPSHEAQHFILPQIPLNPIKPQIPQPYLPFTQGKGSPLSPEVPQQKPKGPKGIEQPQPTYYSPYPYFFYPIDNTKLVPTTQPHTSPLIKPTKSKLDSKVPLTPQGQVPYFPNPWLPQPGKLPEIKPSVGAPAFKPVNGKMGKPFYHQFFYKPPKNDYFVQGPELTPAPTLSPSTQTEGQRQHNFYPLPQKPQQPQSEISPKQPTRQIGQPSYQFPFWTLCPIPTELPSTPQIPLWATKGQEEHPSLLKPGPEKLPEKQPGEKPITAPPPSQPVATDVQVPQYPYYYCLQPNIPGRPAPQQPQPDATKGQVPWHPYYVCPQPNIPEKPTPAPQPPKPDTSKEPVPQLPFFFYPQPNIPEKPTPAPQPPNPDATKEQVLQHPFFLYPQPNIPEKPTPAPQPPQPGATEGQVPQHPYFYPLPNIPVKPTLAPQPSQPDATEGQVPQYPHYYCPHPNIPGGPAPQPPQPDATIGQVLWHPYFLCPQPNIPEKPGPQPAKPDATKEQVPQHPYFYPLPNIPEKPTPAPQPPIPDATEGQIPQHPYFYPLPNIPEKPTSGPQPDATEGQIPQQIYFYPVPNIPEMPSPAPQPDATEGQVPQYPYFYPLPNIPEKPTPTSQPDVTEGQVPQYPYFYPLPNIPEKPTPTPQPDVTEGQVPQYPYFYPVPNIPEKPTPTPQPDVTKGQVPQHPFFFYPLPNIPEKPTLPPQLPHPDTSEGQVPTQSQAQNTAVPPSNIHQVPHRPQLGNTNIPQLYCPQMCPSGLANCCVQIAFHQHLHQYIPQGFGSADASVVYSFPVPHSVFGSYFTAAPPQEPAEATIAPSYSPPSHSSENAKHPYLLPLDGDNEAPSKSVSRTFHNPEQPTYPHFIPNAQYQYLPQNEMFPNFRQSQRMDRHNAFQKHHPSGLGPGNTAVPGPYYDQALGRQINQLLSEKIQLSEQGPKAKSGLESFNVPYSVLQGDQASVNFSQHLVSDSKKPIQKTIKSNPESKVYGLLHPVPSGRNLGSFNEDTLPSRPHSHMPKLQHAKSSSLPADGQSSTEYSIRLPEDPSINPINLKSKFIEPLKDMWRSTAPEVSNQRNPVHPSGKGFQ